MGRKDISYELECWVVKTKECIVVHHTNNGGFPAPGQLGDPLHIHPAKLIIYKSANERLLEKGIDI